MYWRTIWWAPAALLLLALAPLPYGYYQFLRLVVCVCAVLIAIQVKKTTVWFPIFLTVALLFNPIIPVYLTRDIWALIDIACALLFVFHSFAFNSSSDNPGS